MTNKTHAYFFIKKIFFFIKEMMFIKEAPLMNFILIRAKWPSSICRQRSSNTPTATKSQSRGSRSLGAYQR